MARSKDIEPQSVAPHPDDELTRLSTDQIVEQGPGLGAADEAMPPSGDPGDLSGFGRGFGLPDLGVGDDSPVDDLTDPGGLGSTLLGDLDGSSDLPDPTDGIDGLGDGGWGIPEIDDQTGWAMDGDPQGEAGGQYGPTAADVAAEHWAGAAEATDAESAVANTIIAASLMEEHLAETTAPPETQPPTDDDDESGAVDHFGDPIDPPHQDSTPIPEEADSGGGRGGLDPTVTGGGDPAPETEPAGGRGDLIGGRGDVDPDPDLDDVGEATEIDTVAAGLGAVDPVGSTLIGGDAGDLAAVAADPDAGGDLGLDFDDSLADLDLGEEV